MSLVSPYTLNVMLDMIIITNLSYFKYIIHEWLIIFSFNYGFLFELDKLDVCLKEAFGTLANSWIDKRFPIN